jgi:glutaredoxin
VVQHLAAEAGVAVEVRDVDAAGEQGAADRARWSDHVPVVLLDGAQHSMWFVDEHALARALRGR